MAQFNVQSHDYIGGRSLLHDVMMLANKDGSIVDSTHRFPVDANVTIVSNEPAGSKFSFNNHAIATNRGWTMDDTMRPMFSIRVNPSGTTTSSLMTIEEYVLGNNNANQSTVIYEWYEGDLTISGAAIPAWSTVGTRTQYRIYQDKYSTNTGNTFTVPTGTNLRHSGIIIGKSDSGDGNIVTQYGGSTPNMLTLCAKRVDNGTKLDLWFSINIKELA
jgi:hypothetical protein